MSRKLTRTERNTSRQRHRQEQGRRIRDRIKAVLAHDDGYSYADIARMCWTMKPVGVMTWGTQSAGTQGKYLIEIEWSKRGCVI